MALARGIVDGLTDTGLEQVCPRPVTRRNTFGRPLPARVVLTKECEHRLYAVRDLAGLEAGIDAGTAPHDAAS